MRIAIIASPFISVPPTRYGGTELFVATLAEALAAKGVEVVVYANGDSTVHAEVRSRYAHSEWPLASETAGILKELDHVAWAVDDAAIDCDIVHVNSAPAVPLSRFSPSPMVCTMHHPYEAALADLYGRNADLPYVAISCDQASLYAGLNVRTIHHGVDLKKYKLQEKKEDFLCFLGRIAPLKGVHSAIAVAKKSGIPLKIAGEVQPIFRDYFETQIKPHIDGKFIEYVGGADLAMKNEMLGASAGMLFPIEWEEPFGLVMIEAMACGTPVFAFSRGAVPEVVCEGISGCIASTVDEMAEQAQTMQFNAHAIRAWAEQNFSASTMADRYLALYRDTLQMVDDLDPTVARTGEVAA